MSIQSVRLVFSAIIRYVSIITQHDLWNTHTHRQTDRQTRTDRQTDTRFRPVTVPADSAYYRVVVLPAPLPAGLDGADGRPADLRHTHTLHTDRYHKRRAGTASEIGGARSAAGLISRTQRAQLSRRSCQTQHSAQPGSVQHQPSLVIRPVKISGLNSGAGLVSNPPTSGLAPASSAVRVSVFGVRGRR